MKHIFISTFYKAHNYGAVLQAYSLKKFLSKYGYVIFLDYWPYYLKSEYKLVNLKFLEKKLIKKI